MAARSKFLLQELAAGEFAAKIYAAEIHSSNIELSIMLHRALQINEIAHLSRKDVPKFEDRRGH